MAKLKVFGGLISGRGNVQVRTIVATTSKAKAAELFGVSIHHAREYLTETGNKIECEVALAQPGVLFQASSSMGRDFEPVQLGVSGAKG